MEDKKEKQVTTLPASVPVVGTVKTIVQKDFRTERDKKVVIIELENPFDQDLGNFCVEIASPYKKGIYANKVVKKLATDNIQSFEIKGVCSIETFRERGSSRPVEYLKIELENEFDNGALLYAKVTDKAERAGLFDVAKEYLRRPAAATTI